MSQEGFSLRACSWRRHGCKSLWFSRHCAPTVPVWSGYHNWPAVDDWQNYDEKCGPWHASKFLTRRRPVLSPFALGFHADNNEAIFCKSHEHGKEPPLACKCASNCACNAGGISSIWSYQSAGYHSKLYDIRKSPYAPRKGLSRTFSIEYKYYGQLTATCPVSRPQPQGLPAGESSTVSIQMPEITRNNRITCYAYRTETDVKLSEHGKKKDQTKSYV
jgi:hypothetical protein